MNTIEKKFLENIHARDLARKGEKVLLAVSGGPDSMALLHLFHAVAPVLGCSYGVAHCNFSLRGKESDGDELFVSEVCRTLGCECHVRRFETESVASAWKKSIEETARIVRYGYFGELCREEGYCRIATGHHIGDNAETILFNLFRGTSLAGLRGIRSKHGNIIRPLLLFSRQEIMEYLGEKKCAWRTDSSNEESGFDRNYIRNRVIPVIEERFSHKFSSSLQRLSEHAGELEEFIDSHIGKLIASSPGLDISGGKLHVVTLRQLTIFERKEILKRTLKMLGHVAGSRTLERIAALVDNQSGRLIQAGGGIEVIRKDGFLRFRRVDAPPDAEAEHR